MVEKNIFAQGSIAEYRNDGDDLDRYYLPARSLAFRDRHRSALFLLPDISRIHTYEEQLQQIRHELGLATAVESRPIYVPDTDYLLDVALLAHQNEIARELPSGHSYIVYPYAVTHDTQNWIAALRERGHTITASMPVRTYYEDLYDLSHRGGWSRHVSMPDQPSFPEITGIPYPTAFMGMGEEEAVEAYKLVVAATQNPEVFFKPVFSAGGFTLKKVASPQEVREHYVHLKEQGALDILDQETPIEMQAAIPSERQAGFYSLQFHGKMIITPKTLTEQLMSGVNWAGNIFNNGVQPRLAHQANEIFNRFVRGYELRTGKAFDMSGGMDFGGVIDDEGSIDLRLIEVNGNRITGADPAIALQQGLQVESPYMTQKSPGPVNCDLQTLWTVLKGLSCQFDPKTKTGIFPIVWMEGSGMLWAAARDVRTMSQNLERTYNELARHGYISTS